LKTNSNNQKKKKKKEAILALSTSKATRSSTNVKRNLCL